jgi:type IV secretory pathway VirD2 relaxase
MSEMERDLGTKVEWIAVDHWNTEHPHVHVIVRGKGDDGQDLVISRDYISHGLRTRAEHLVTLELDPGPIWRSPRTRRASGRNLTVYLQLRLRPMIKS